LAAGTEPAIEPTRAGSDDRVLSERPSASVEARRRAGLALGVSGAASYALTVPSLVGRDGELAAVDSFLSGVTDPAVLVIVGEPGIGKTTVWEEAVRRARAAGSLVLQARPTAAEARLSFAALADIVSPVGAELFAALPEPQRRALDIALLRVEARGAPPERRTVGTALLSLLRAISAEQDVVVAIDDVQWLDRPSAAALEFAARRLTDERVHVIASVRTEDAPSSGLASLPGTQRLALGPVSVAALHGIVEDRLGRSLPRPLLVRIAEASGGNPLYALELARHDGDDALPVPRDIRALVAKRVAALPQETRDALLRAAALTRPDRASVDIDALVPAEEAGLVTVDGAGRIAFVHPLFASAVYAAAPYAHRRAAHESLAASVRDGEERARHLALACDGPNLEVAAAVEEAARLARARGASDSAAELCELALQLTPPEAAEHEARRIALAEQLLFAGDFERVADELRRLAAELPPGNVRARVLLMLAQVDYWRLGEGAAVVLVEQAVAEAVDPEIVTMAYVSLASYAGTREVERASWAAERALAHLRELPSAPPALASAAYSAHVRANLFLGNGLDRDGMARALELEGDAQPAAVDMRMNFVLAQWLRYVDDLDASRARLADAEKAARDEGDESSLPNILLNRTLQECWSGNLGLAAQLAEDARHAFLQVGVASAARDVWKAYVDAHLGRIDDVREAALASRDIVEPNLRMLWERASGLAELSTGDAVAANRHLSVATRILDEMHFAEPAVWRVEGDAIEAAIGAGELDRAEARVVEFEQCASRSRIPWSLAVSARCRALLEAARGDLDAALEAVARALDEHAHSPVPFEHARTQLVHGQILRRVKQKRLAREALEDARAAFVGLGAELWAARADDELRRVATRAASDDLSATELRIAQLAAAGRTNSEIAAEVFVSQKTVEANLARVYRKLEIRGRAQLAHALDAREPQAIP